MCCNSVWTLSVAVAVVALVCGMVPTQQYRALRVTSTVVAPASVALPPNSLLAESCVSLLVSPETGRPEWEVDGSETVIASPDGSVLYGASAHGTVFRVVDGVAAVMAHIGGRPLGLALHPELGLLIADAARGLVAVDLESGRVTLLASSVDGAGADRIAYADDVDVDPVTGTVYLSDASTVAPWLLPDGASYATMDASIVEAVEAQRTGRLLAYHPENGTVTVVAESLYFANGVAVARDGSYAVVAETFAAQLTRVELVGPNKGAKSVFIDGVPGYIDGVSATEWGTFWMGIASPRSALLETLHPYPWVKQAILKIPREWVPKPPKVGLAIEVDANGNVLRAPQDPTGEVVDQVTAVHAVSPNKLVLGSLHQRGIRVCELPA